MNEKMVERMGKISVYPLQEKILNKIFKKHFKNTDVNGIKVKAEILNLYYSTGVREIDKMAQHIKRLKIDKKLQQGDLYKAKDLSIRLRRNIAMFITPTNIQFMIPLCENYYAKKKKNMNFMKRKNQHYRNEH